MRVPRRSPFTQLRHAELLNIYQHLFPDSAFLESSQSSPVDRNRALSIVQLWINRASCPHAVESTASLIQAIIFDQHMLQFAASVLTASNPHSDPCNALSEMGGGAEIGIRMNYSMTITRFVNTVADSYQTGNFAQSIASIAARIGMPHWFVELRHAATHEELPSLTVCRDGARAALEWLHSNFWIPILFPSSPGDESVEQEMPASTLSVVDLDSEPVSEEDQKERAEAISKLCDLLKSYKKIGKQVARDQSLMGRNKAEILKMLKQIQTWISKHSVADEVVTARMTSSIGRKRSRTEIDEQGAGWNDDDNTTFEEMQGMKLAMDDFVQELVKPGGMIPLSKSKRVKSSATGSQIELPDELEMIWGPLITHMRQAFGFTFGSALVQQLLASFCHVAITADDSKSKTQEDWKHEAFSQKSYRQTAQAWLRHLVVQDPTLFVDEKAQDVEGSPEMDLVERCLKRPSQDSVSLVGFLCDRDASLADRLNPLLTLLTSPIGFAMADLESVTAESLEQPQGNPMEVTVETGFEEALCEMESRLAQMDRKASASDMDLDMDAAATTTSKLATPTTTAPNCDTSTPVSGVSQEQLLPVGWSRAASCWQPTPLGCLEGKVPNLYLDADVLVV